MSYEVGDITKALLGHTKETSELEEFFGSKASAENEVKKTQRKRKRTNEADDNDDDEDDTYRRPNDDIHLAQDEQVDSDDEDQQPKKKQKLDQRAWEKDTEKLERSIFVGNFPIKGKNLKVCTNYS
jgi:hypothetical protein